VLNGSGEAKYWIDPEVSMDSSRGFGARELNELQGVVYEKSELIREKWNEYFGT
jgi:hypothetical protein